MEKSLRNGLLLLTTGFALLPIVWFLVPDEGWQMLNTLFWVIVLVILPGIIMSIVGAVKEYRKKPRKPWSNNLK